MRKGGSDTKFYFTGKPCKRGHVCGRYESSGNCMECSRQSDHWRRNRDPERLREYSRKRRAENPEVRERDRERSRKWRETNNWRDNQEPSPSRKIRELSLSRVRYGLQKGLECDSSFIPELSGNPPKNCPCCGVEINYDRGQGRGGTAFSPSIDRLIPSIGYMHGNVAVICLGCNTAKGNSTLADLDARGPHYRFIADYVRSNLKKE